MLVGGVALLTVLAAGGILFAVHVSDQALARLVASQNRLDLLAQVSGRLTEYALAAIDGTNAAPREPERLAALRERAETALAALDASGREADGQPVDATRSGRGLAHLRADFETLDNAVQRALTVPDAPSRADAIRGSLNAFALSAAPTLSLLVDAERRAVQSGRNELQLTSKRLALGAIAAAALVVLGAALLHRAITRPLLQRIGAIEDASRAITRGNHGARLAIGAHDELGLAVARFNRMAAVQARRERRLHEDRVALERTVAERTRELTAANEKLAAIDTSRRRFFADVSHELRTPLTVVLGECDVALRSPSISESEVRTTLTTIRQRASRLNRSVEDLLRVARSESGELALDFRRVALESILRDAVESFSAHAARKGVELSLDLPQGPIEVPADREWIRQVVEGLIENALRHASGAARIAVSLEALPAEAPTILVSDDGCGIPSEAREQVFERFARRRSERQIRVWNWACVGQMGCHTTSRHHPYIIAADDEAWNRGGDTPSVNRRRGAEDESGGDECPYCRRRSRISVRCSRGA